MANQIEQLDEGKKLKVTLETGEVFEGDPLEVTNKMAAAHVETKRWGQAAHAEVKTLKEKPVVATQTATQVTATAEEAQLRSYLANQTAQFLGLKDGDELKKKLEWLDQSTTIANNRGKVATFYAENQDFPNNPENVEKISKRMAEMGFPDENSWTPVALRAAHRDCVAEGLYKPLTSEEWANNMSSANRGTPPPMLRSNSNENTQGVDLWAEDPQKQRERIIREQLAQQGR